MVEPWLVFWNTISVGYSPANAASASILNSSGTLVVFTLPFLSKAILTTPAAGSDAPSDPDALEEKLLKRDKYTECASLKTSVLLGSNFLSVLLNLPPLSDIDS